MCAVRKAQLRWQDATFSVPHVSVRCSRPQPDGCKEEYCEGKQKREAEQSERRKEEPEKKKSEGSQTTDSALCCAGACSGGRDRWRGILGGAFDEGNRRADCTKHAGIDDGRGKHSSCCYRRNRRDAGDGTRNGNRNGDRDGNRNACRADRGQYRRLCKSGILQNCAGDGNLFGKGVGGGKAGER